MAVLVIGGSGKLGKEVLKVFQGALAPCHREVDLTEKGKVAEYVKVHQPSVIIHTAAMTNVRKCEENRDRAWKINVIGTEAVVDACLLWLPDVYFIYISTACVFDGHRGFYTEDDIPYPENFYGFTKLIGEFIVKKLPRHLIIRTNFITRDKWPYPKAFTDRFGTYLFTEDVAKGIAEVVEAGLTGIVHITGDKKLSMYSLAKITTPDVLPMTLAEHQGPSLTVDMTLTTVRWRTYQLSP